MKNCMKDFSRAIGQKIGFWLPLVLSSLLAYGVSITRSTVSIDDLSLDYYGGIRGAMVASGRWGIEIWHRLIGVVGYSSYIYKFFGVVFLLAAAFLLCCIFYSLRRKARDAIYPYTFFAVIFVTFPLINEIWEYNGANAMVAGNLALAFLAILYQMTGETKYWKKAALSGLLMTLVAASYESILFVYICLVLCILFYRYCIAEKPAKKKGSWVVDGLAFVPPLTVAVILRFVIGFLWRTLLHIHPLELGATKLMWSEFSRESAVDLLRRTFAAYFLKIEYLPICLFVLATLVFLVIVIRRCVVNRSARPLLIGLCLYISIFLLGIFQFSFLNYRTAQTIGLFVAFVVFLLCLKLQSTGRKGPKVVVLALLCLVSVYQATCLAQILEWNHQRSENEITVVHQLGAELTREYDDRPIVICGNYNMGSYLDDRSTVSPDRFGGQTYDRFRETADITSNKLMDTNVNSLLTWSAHAFRYQSEVNVMKNLFSYCGYDLNIRKLNGNEYKEYEQQARDLGMAPLEIRDTGEYVLVYLGE